jgi:hypothetical protein
MKMTTFDTSILGGQGSVGSYGLGAPNPAPTQAGPAAGADGNLSVQVASPEAVSVTHHPDQGIYDSPGGAHTTDTLYTTIGPVPEG